MASNVKKGQGSSRIVAPAEAEEEDSRLFSLFCTQRPVSTVRGKVNLDQSILNKTLNLEQEIVQFCYFI
jgi:hypothetical protein